MATKTWQAAAPGNWSTGANWGGSVPATTDTVQFVGATSNQACTIDALGTWSGGPLTIDINYTATITQSVNIVTGAFSMANGTWTTTLGSETFQSTTFAMTGGTFNQGGTFTSTTFGITNAAAAFVGSANAMSTTAVTLSAGALTATSGIWTLAGNWTKSGAPTFTHNSGTINITAASTFNAASLTFNKINITTSNAAVSISASTTAPLGATPTTTVGTSTLTLAGTITWSGTWTHTGSFTTNNGATITGSSTPALTINTSVTVTNVTTITNAITLTFTGTAVSALTDTSSLIDASGSLVVVTKSGVGSFMCQANTICPVGTAPTMTAVTISIVGTLFWSGTLTVVGGGAGSFSTSNGTTLHGDGVAALVMTSSLTVALGTTITHAIGSLTFTGTATYGYYQFSDTTDLLGAGCTTTISLTQAVLYILNTTTIRLGNNPTVTTGITTSGAGAVVSGSGVLTVTATTVTGGLSFASGGTLTGFTSAHLDNCSWSAVSGATIPANFDVSFHMTAAVSGATGYLTITHSAAVALRNVDRTGASTDWFYIPATGWTCSSWTDNDGLAAHGYVFAAGATFTVTTLALSGSRGNLIDWCCYTPYAAYTFTVTTAAGNKRVSWLRIARCVADVSPLWVAGGTCIDGGNNTNWIFEPKSSAKPRVVCAGQQSVRGRNQTPA